MTDPENNPSSTPLLPTNPSYSRSVAPWCLVSEIKFRFFDPLLPVGCCLVLLSVFLLRGLQTTETFPGLYTTVHLQQIQGESLDSPSSAKWDNSDIRHGVIAEPTAVKKTKKAAVEGFLDLKNVSKDPWRTLGAPKVPKECDLFHGEWIRDESSPLYTSNTCKIIISEYDCQGNGRPNSGYEQYRWKPHECELPRFNAKQFLESMKGKRILFVGDSLARNQCQSLVCLLDQEEEQVFKGDEHKANYTFRKHDVVVSHIWSAWLVDEEVGNIPSIDKPNVTLLHIDRIGKSWLDQAVQADILIVSSGHWYGRPTIFMMDGKPVGFSSLHIKNRTLTMDKVEAFRLGMRTVLTQLRDEPKFKGLLLFRSYTPDHYEGGSWHNRGRCSEITEPKPADFVYGNEYGKTMYKHQVDEFSYAFDNITNKEISKRFVFLDIMPMASTRADGHPGPYRNKGVVERMKNMKESDTPPPQDCLHWCLPGIPDRWNELLLPLARRSMVA